MVTHTQIAETVRMVMPLSRPAILTFLADAPASLPIALLERATETPFVAPFAAVLLAALVRAISFAMWGVVFTISIAVVFSLNSVIFMTSFVVSILGRALGLVAP